jgi:hypothetical protein
MLKALRTFVLDVVVLGGFYLGTSILVGLLTYVAIQGFEFGYGILG